MSQTSQTDSDHEAGHSGSDISRRLAQGLRTGAASQFRRQYLLRMMTLPLLDLGVFLIYILITHRFEVVGKAIANLLFLELLCFTVGWWLYRPIAGFEAMRVGHEAAAQRIRNLPRYSAWAAFLLALVASFVSIWLKVYAPPEANFDALPQPLVAMATLFVSCIYAVFYSYFIYFYINDLGINMRRALRDALEFKPNPALKGGLGKKLAIIFVVISLVPALLLGMDLTVFAPVRAVQGLETRDVIALDLIVSMYVIITSIIFVSRSLLAPTQELYEAQEAVRRGDLKSKAAVLTEDELGQVTSRFNVMVDALRERDLIKSALHRYLSPSVADELIESGGVIESKLVEATVMFTDIQGFTTLSETLQPEETVELLNAYFSVMNAIIHKEGGTVNNFIGDAVVAIFNVPIQNATHAKSAVQAARAIQQALATETFTLASGRTVSLPTRVGINTGSVCAGVIGSSERQGYTVYGDAVNLAARIEPLNKRYGTRILASESTIRLAYEQGLSPAGVIAQERTTVAGRKEDVMVYRIEASI